MRLATLKSRGAESVILVGYSMGGAIVTNFLYRAPLAAKVRGVILDAPMLDLGSAIDHGVRQRGLPVFPVRDRKISGPSAL